MTRRDHGITCYLGRPGGRWAWGQQSMLFERGVPFRSDWEAVLTPVIDFLAGRSDVDASALTGYGISQGGYWITRALAFERRMGAAVADPGVVDVSAGWTAHLPPALLDLVNSGQRTRSTPPWPMRRPAPVWSRPGRWRSGQALWHDRPFDQPDVIADLTRRFLQRRQAHV
jgi:hypothetical protein